MRKYRRRKRSTTPSFPNQILASRQHRRMCNSIAIESKLRLDSGTTRMCQNLKGRGAEGRSYPLRCGTDPELPPRKRRGCLLTIRKPLLILRTWLTHVGVRARADAEASGELVVLTTTTTQDSGMILQHLVDAFGKSSGLRVKAMSPAVATS